MGQVQHGMADLVDRVKDVVSEEFEHVAVQSGLAHVRFAQNKPVRDACSPVTRLGPPRVLLKLWPLVDKAELDEKPCDATVFHLGLEARLQAVGVA